MKRRDVLITTAVIAFAGCLDGGNNSGNNNGGTTGSSLGTTDESTTADTETTTSTTDMPTATDAGTNRPQTARKTEIETTTDPAATTAKPTDTVTGPTETTETSPDRPTPISDTPNGAPLTGEAHVSFENGGTRIVVTGTIIGKNGCQRPVLDSVRQTKSGLIITIATERDAPKNAACTMALVELEYQYPVTVNDSPKSVTIIHRGATGKETITSAKIDT